MFNVLMRNNEQFEQMKNLHDITFIYLFIYFEEIE